MAMTQGAAPRGARSRTALSNWSTASSFAFLFLPQGEDPETPTCASSARTRSRNCLAMRCHLSQFLLRELSSRVDLNTHEGRARLLQDAKPLVAQIKARFWAG